MAVALLVCGELRYFERRRAAHSLCQIPHDEGKLNIRLKNRIEYREGTDGIPKWQEGTSGRKVRVWRWR